MKISKHQAVIVSSIVTVMTVGLITVGVSAVQGPADIEPEIGGPAATTIEATPETVEPGVETPQPEQVVVQESQTQQVVTPQPKAAETTPQPVVETTVEQVPEVTPQPEITYQGDMSTSSRHITEFPHPSN